MDNPVVIVVLVLVGLGGLWVVVIWNRFVSLKQHVRESWADIDVELKRRYELIPNLVATVKGFAQHERELLERVVAARDRAAGNHGRIGDQARAEVALQAGLRQLFAVVENYPQLRADRSFLALQEELAITEDRIAAARRFYNGNVRELCNLRESFPTNLVGSLAGVADVSFFELDDDRERAVPHVRV